MKLYWLCISLLLSFITGCSEENSDNPIQQENPDEPNQVKTVIPSGEEPYLKLKSDYIFDQEKLYTYELILPQAHLARLDQDPAAEEYVEGTLVFQGDTISPVGIRYKGSVGGFVGCVSGSDWANPSGNKTCTKLSMKVKINWQGRDEKFFGLKKLQFHSQNLDDSQMRDRLGYWLFREMDVKGPRAVHAKLMINGTYSGLYSLVEQIDGRMTRYNWDDGKGNLYKEIWPLRSNGRAYTEADYAQALKTNEDEADVSIMSAFATSIISADDQAALQEVIRNSMNLEEIMAYCVVDRTIRHDDGPFHWYCNGSSCTSHNFYWYEEPQSKKLHLIPWDLDNAFENIIIDRNPVTPIADQWGESQANCEPFSHGPLRLRQWSAACDKLTSGWASFSEEYDLTKEKFISGPFSEGQVNQKLTEWSEQIRAATEEAAAKHDDALRMSQWEAGIESLRRQVSFANNL